MADLPPESKVIYDLLMVETREAYEERFLAHKKQILDSIKNFVDDTTKQFKTVHDLLGDEIGDAHASIGEDLEQVKSKLSAEISHLSATIDRAIRSIPNASAGGSPATPTCRPGDGTIGPAGHHSATDTPVNRDFF